MKLPSLSSFSFLGNVSRRWRFPKAVITFFIVELPFTVAGLALFGIADPDLYRTRLWQEGSNHGWNSNPNEILYAYANYRPISVPLPWSQLYAASNLLSALAPILSIADPGLFPSTDPHHYFASITSYNVIISVLSMFLLLVKAVMFILHVWHPLLSLSVHSALTAIWAVSIHAQAASDMSDPNHPQPGTPWYISKGCGPPVSQGNHGYCLQAKGAFAVTVVMCGLFFLNTLLALYSLLPISSNRQSRPAFLRRSSSSRSDVETSDETDDQKWELNNLPSIRETVPATPRTQAFNTLGGLAQKKTAPKVGVREIMKGKKARAVPEVGVRAATANAAGRRELPLRHHISMGDETYKGPIGR